MNIFARLSLVVVFLAAQGCIIYFFYFHFYGELERTSQVAGYWISLTLWVIFSILWIWAHICTSWLDAGSVQAQLDDLHLTDPSQYPQYIAALNVCPRCGLPKPPRTHHCSDCNKCYFRFDHHCPYIGNCVALKNMKAFMLFLTYSGILCFIIAGTLLLYLDENTPFPKYIFWVFFGLLCFMGVWFAGFGLSYIRNVCNNQTTLEGIARLDPSTYDQGHTTNFKQVFGESPWRWFLPIPMNVNGFMWSIAQDPDYLN